MQHGCHNKAHSPFAAKRAVLFAAPRAVFQHKPAKTAVERIEKNTGLGKMAEEREKRINEPVNAETRFSPEPEKNVRLLAEKAYPKNKAEQDRYAEKIKASLQAYLKEGQSMEALWKYLEENYCQTTAIIEGILRFFAGQKGEKEISIANFLKPVKIEAESTLHKTLTEARENQIGKTRADLQTLLTELKAQHPDLPQANA